MNVNTIQISRDDALTKLTQYKALNAKQRTREDEALQSMYRAVSNGARVVNVTDAFRQTGLNEKGQPRLAIAQADWKTVYFHPKCFLHLDGKWVHSDSWRAGAGTFTDTERFNKTAYQKVVSLPGGTFADNLATKNIRSRVPHVPPNIRPTIHLRNYHILFEVENWETYPVDPYLLRRISNSNLFVVVAEWELTKLEAMLLGSMTGN